jgi:hypothetical protein
MPLAAALNLEAGVKLLQHLLYVRSYGFLSENIEFATAIEDAGISRAYYRYHGAVQPQAHRACHRPERKGVQCCSTMVVSAAVKLLL